jgi:hypothetical protein
MLLFKKHRRDAVNNPTETTDKPNAVQEAQNNQQNRAALVFSPGTDSKLRAPSRQGRLNWDTAIAEWQERKGIPHPSAAHQPQKPAQ